MKQVQLPARVVYKDKLKTLLKTKLSFNETVAEYALDPNCRPKDWISDQAFNWWTEKDKKAFLQIAEVLFNYRKIIP